MKISSKILTLCLSILFISNTFAQAPAISKSDKTKVVEAFLYSHFEGENIVGTLGIVFGAILDTHGLWEYRKNSKSIETLNKTILKDGKSWAIFYQDYVTAQKKISSEVKFLKKTNAAKNKIINLFYDRVRLDNSRTYPITGDKVLVDRLREEVIKLGTDLDLLYENGKEINGASEQFQLKVQELAKLFENEYILAFGDNLKRTFSDLTYFANQLRELTTSAEKSTNLLTELTSKLQKRFQAADINFSNWFINGNEIPEIGPSSKVSLHKYNLFDQKLLKIEIGAGAFMIAMGGWMIYHHYQSRVATENEPLSFNESIGKLYSIHQNGNAREFTEAIGKLADTYLNTLFDISMIHYLAYEGKLAT